MPGRSNVQVLSKIFLFFETRISRYFLNELQLLTQQFLICVTSVYNFVTLAFITASLIKILAISTVSGIKSRDFFTTWSRRKGDKSWGFLHHLKFQELGVKLFGFIQLASAHCDVNIHKP